MPIVRLVPVLAIGLLLTSCAPPPPTVATGAAVPAAVAPKPSAYTFFGTSVDDLVGTKKVISVHEGGIRATHGGTKFAGYALVLLSDGSGIWVRERYGNNGAPFVLPPSEKSANGSLVFKMPNNQPLSVNPMTGNFTWKIQETDLESHDVKIIRPSS